MKMEIVNYKIFEKYCEIKTDTFRGFLIDNKCSEGQKDFLKKQIRLQLDNSCKLEKEGRVFVDFNKKEIENNSDNKYNCWLYKVSKSYLNEEIYDIEEEDFCKVVNVSGVYGNRYTIEYKNKNRLEIDITSKKKKQRFITKDFTLLNGYNLKELCDLLDDEYEWSYRMYLPDTNKWFCYMIENIKTDIKELPYIIPAYHYSSKLISTLNEQNISPKFIEEMLKIENGDIIWE